MFKRYGKANDTASNLIAPISSSKPTADRRSAKQNPFEQCAPWHYNCVGRDTGFCNANFI